MSFAITLVTLGVSELDRSIAFYRALGFPLEDRASDADVAFFSTRGTWLALHPRDRLAGDAGVSPDGEGFEGFTLAHNVDAEAAVDACLDEAAAAGATVRKAGQPADWGGYAGYFADPDGHLWEVAHNPFMAFE